MSTSKPPPASGLAAVPIMALIMGMGSNVRITGKFAVAGPLHWAGWVATGATDFAAAGMLWPG